MSKNLKELVLQYEKETGCVNGWPVWGGRVYTQQFVEWLAKRATQDYNDGK
jgi:hypothetical protein